MFKGMFALQRPVLYREPSINSSETQQGKLAQAQHFVLLVKWACLYSTSGSL